jgi:hypothetical protein
MNEKKEIIPREERNRVAEIARLVARLSKHEQDKFYYMLKALEIFNTPAV